MAFVENSRAGKLGLHDFDLYGQTVNSQRLRGAVTDVDAMGICCTKWLWSTARTGRLALLVSGEIPENAPASFLQPTTRLGLAPNLWEHTTNLKRLLQSLYPTDHVSR